MVLSKHNDNAIALKLVLFFIIAGGYMFLILFVSRFVYPNCLYFCPRTTFITAVINTPIITFGSLLISSITRKWLNNFKKKFLVIACIILVLTYPLVFLKSGVVIDDKYICKNDIFGNPTEKYSYSDVSSFEISVKFGVEYDIKFDSEKTISLYSHEMTFINYFRNEKNIQHFDKLLEAHAKRTVYKSIYSTPQHLKYFFEENEYYNYFNQIFNSD